MNNFFLYLVLDSIAEKLVARRITSCRYLKPIFSLEIGGEKPRGEGGIFLVSILASPGPFLFLSHSDPFSGYEAPPAIPGAAGSSIKSITQYEGQRIALLEIEKTGGSPACLYVCLFGRTGSVYLLEEGRVSGGIGMRKAGKPPWSKRKTRNFVTISGSELCASLRVQTPVDGLSDELVAYYKDSNPERTASHLVEFRDSLCRKNVPLALIHADRPVRSSPFPATEKEMKTSYGIAGPFSNPEEAARYVGEAALKRSVLDIVSSQTKPLRRLLKSKRELVEKLERELEQAMQFESVRKQGETLAAFQGRVNPGARNVELPDPYDEETSILIELDPSRSIQEEIERRFKRATKMKRSLPTIRKRIQQVKKETKDLEHAVEKIAEKQNLKAAITELERAFRRWKVEPGGKVIKKEERGKTYRRFDLDGNWFALVGRNNRENDEITFSLASPGDIWMHAQGVPGSHVVLKSKGHQENPPATIIEAAAGIAAYYSKAKHSSVVPVIYTRRKYVRKPRKAPPGQVTCSNEKTVFAVPGIPRQAKVINNEEEP